MPYYEKIKDCTMQSLNKSIILNMEYCRKSPGEALFLPGKAAEIQIKGNIALFIRLKLGADFSTDTGAAYICPTDGHTISKA